MTGNTKVWRAPLAGLASVAMIATMGVAASTASAAPTTDYVYPGVTVTLDANGGSFTAASYSTADGKADVSKDKKTLTLTDYQNQNVDGYSYADGVFAKDLYGVFGTDAAIQWDAQQARAFSGWYTEKQGGQAVDPTTALADGTTLYAHWSQGAADTDESEDLVTVSTEGEVTYADPSFGPDGHSSVIQQSSDPNTYFIRLADGDQLAGWELPSVDAQVNHVVPSFDESAVSSAEAGDTLTVVKGEGATVTIKRTGADHANYDIYKDGVAVNTTGDETFDVLTGSSLSEYQAVTSGTNKLLANSWKIWTGTAESNKTDYTWGTAFPAGNAFTLEPQGGEQSTVVRVHKWSKGAIDLRYFVLRGSNFQKTFGKALEDVVRPNAQFLGWYNKDQQVTWVGQTTPFTNDDFFDAKLIKTSDSVDPWKSADPIKFDFTATLNGESVDLYAGYASDARFTTITLDPNYSGADKISVKIYAGKKIGDQLPTVTRDGYTLEGWYADSVTFTTKLDTTKKATTNPDYPAAGSTWYAKWSADSKYGVNGLLFNLARGYATGISDNNVPGKGYYASFTNSPSVPVALEANGRKDDNGVALYTHATQKHETATYKFVVRNPGYVETTWAAFVKSRDEVVVPALIKELNLAKDADIATVYEAVATKLSAEKADEFNQQFAKVASDKASFPDVNYDDYGTHSDEITSLYKKGIVKGYPDGTFGYGAKLARVDYIVWLYRAAGSPAVDSQAPFSDVNEQTVPNKDFRDAVAWAAANKITTGYADGTFAPYATLNRQDAAAFLYRAAGSPKFNESYADVKFADVTPGDSANHSQAVLWAASNDIVKGYSGTVNKFSGNSILVRQDAAAFLARTLDHGYIAK